MNHPFLHASLAVGVAALASGAAAAGATSEPAGPPLIAACQACHGRDGISEQGGIPNLAGQKKGYLVNQLMAFRSGERKNDLMSAVARQLDDAAIGTLATHWSGMPAVVEAATRSPATASTAIRSRMGFPAAFPNGFTLYDTVASDQGVAQRYANDVALQAARRGAPLPQGAVIIVANHAAQLDAAQRPVLDAQGRALAGRVLSYAGMESRAGWGAAVPALLRNGDWDYALFGADRARRDTLNQAPCLACHQPLAADSHVFTLKTLAAVATAKPAPR